MKNALSRDFEPAIKDVKAELVKQDVMWGEANDRAHTLYEWFGIVLRETTDLSVVACPIPPHADPDTEKSRAALVKIAAVAISAIEDIDHKSAPLPG